jgi:hypothetical protein
MIRSLGMLAFACALAVPVVSFAQQTDDGAFNSAGTYRATVPTESINPTCNGGAPGVVGKTYGGNVCPPAGGAATLTASLGAFAPGSANNTVGLSATTTSSSIALGTGSTTVVTNTGTTTVYVAFGGSGVIATTSGSPVLAGSQFAFSNGSNTYMAAITGSGSAALLVTTGTGLPAVGGAGGSGGVPYTLNGDGGVPSHLTNGPTGYALESGHIATVDTNTASLAASVGAKTDASCLATDTTAEGQICLLKGAIVELKATVSALQSLGITNTAFGISGTLPGFASTPTFNLGTSPNLTFTNTGFNALQGGAANSASNPFYFGQATGSIFSVADTNLLAAVNGPTPPQTTKQVDIGAVEQTIAAPVASTAAEACHVLKASAGILYSVGGLAGQAEYFMLFNATSAPADGTVTPVWWGQAGAAGYWGVSFPNPLSLSTGVTVCASSTAPFTKTAISTGNVFSGQVQ